MHPEAQIFHFLIFRSDLIKKHNKHRKMAIFLRSADYAYESSDFPRFFTQTKAKRCFFVLFFSFRNRGCQVQNKSYNNNNKK